MRGQNITGGVLCVGKILWLVFHAWGECYGWVFFKRVRRMIRVVFYAGTMITCGLFFNGIAGRMRITYTGINRQQQGTADYKSTYTNWGPKNKQDRLQTPNYVLQTCTLYRHFQAPNHVLQTCTLYRHPRTQTWLRWKRWIENCGSQMKISYWWWDSRRREVSLSKWLIIWNKKKK